MQKNIEEFNKFPKISINNMNDLNILRHSDNNFLVEYTFDSIIDEMTLIEIYEKLSLYDRVVLLVPKTLYNYELYKVLCDKLLILNLKVAKNHIVFNLFSVQSLTPNMIRNNLRILSSFKYNNTDSHNAILLYGINESISKIKSLEQKIKQIKSINFEILEKLKKSDNMLNK